jgi:alanine dehydrogenase
VALLRELGIRGVSLDSLTDDRGRRLVENLESVGWNGVQSAFRELAKTYRDFDRPGRRGLRVTVLGSGAVGGHAARAATRYGDESLRRQLAEKGVLGVEVTTIDYDLAGHENYMLTRFESTDLLIDATQRPDPSRPVVPNDWIEALPHHAVMLDLSVDPYDFTVTPHEVKGIEGIPEGPLDQYVFMPDDPIYDSMDPRIATKHRRVALSCYSWPGVHPRACMEVYGSQLQSLVRVALDQDLATLDAHHFFERAVLRADVERWKSKHTA